MRTKQGGSVPATSRKHFVDEVAREDAVLEAAKKMTGENPRAFGAIFMGCATGTTLAAAGIHAAVQHYLFKFPIP